MPAHGILLHNAAAGWQNSQLELAKFYLLEKQDCVEAYAWVDVACLNYHKDAPTLKKISKSS